MTLKYYQLPFLIVFFLMFFILQQNGIMAGTTGKISGVIIDYSTDEPLPGANIVLEGTFLGAASDLDGFYNILTIPPGTYTVKVSMIGYKTVYVEEVQVRTDLTTIINAHLETTVLEADEAVIVVAERPLIQKDMTSSLATVSAHEFELSPAQSVGEILSLQAGVTASTDGIHIRGGRTGEVAYWLDGVMVTDVYDGGMGISVDQFAVQELQVVSGTFNAEYGRAMSGIVNVITKEGSDNYDGQIRVSVGDYVSNSPIYEVLSDVNVHQNPQTGRITTSEQTENPLADLNPTYSLDFNFGGPVPLTNNKLTFFTSGRLYSREGYLYGREWYTPQGMPGDSTLVPLNPYESKLVQLKLSFRPFPTLKFNYNMLWNDSHTDKVYSHNYRYNPGGIPKGQNAGITHTFSINHILSPSTFYDFRLSYFNSDYKWHLYDDPNARPHWLVRVVDTGQIIDLDTPEGQAEFNRIKQVGLEFEYFIDPGDPDGYVHPDSSNAPASYSFLKAGNSLWRESRDIAYWIGKFDLTSKVSNVHQIKFGAELILHELSLDAYNLQAKRYEDRDEQIVPFVPDIPPISTVYHDQYTRKPREFSAYLQDKIELQNLIMNIGLRFDYFDANSNIPANPGDPNIYDPFLNENIYKNPEAPEDERVEYTPEERRSFMQKKVEAKTKLSPRLGIAYPITATGVIHFSYGHFFQIPEFQYLYDVPDFKLFSGGGRSIVGNPDLKPQQTVQYEVGFSQALFDLIGIDFTLFYRDIRDWNGVGPPIQTARTVVSYSMYENKDYSNVIGLTLKLQKRMSHNWSANLDYSYEVVEGTYSNPTDAFYALLAEEEPRLDLIPLSWDQRHILNVQINYTYKGWIASFIGKYRTGEPYTPVFAKGARIGGQALSGLVTNSARKPNIHSYDIHLKKRFQMGSMNFGLFMYVYNLFDQRGELFVYQDTGTASYTTDPSPGEMPYDPNRIGTVEHLLLRPDFYIAPRQILLGISLDF